MGKRPGEMEKRQGTGDSQLRQRKRAGKGLMEGKDKRENLKGQGEKRDRRHGKESKKVEMDKIKRDREMRQGTL